MKKIIQNIKNKLAYLSSAYKELFTAYGGATAFFCSPYLWLSGVLSLITSLFACEGWYWYASALAVLPNLLGFTLAGYAVFFAFMDTRFSDFIRGKKEGERISPYLGVSSVFAVFVVLQLATLFLAVLFDAIQVKIILVNFMCTWLFMYAMSLGLAATMGLFMLSTKYDRMKK